MTLVDDDGVADIPTYIYYLVDIIQPFLVVKA